METISIPSPSTILDSPALRPAIIPPRRSEAASARESGGQNSASTTARKSPAPPLKRGPPSNTDQPQPQNKPKQSKSRNGCLTCKAKRLKCDENKPSCQQCHKRGVQCGGYRKDFKWRRFEEASFATKPAPTKRRQSPPPPLSFEATETPATSEHAGNVRRKKTRSRARRGTGPSPLQPSETSPSEKSPRTGSFVASNSSPSTDIPMLTGSPPTASFSEASSSQPMPEPGGLGSIFENADPMFSNLVLPSPDVQTSPSIGLTKELSKSDSPPRLDDAIQNQAPFISNPEEEIEEIQRQAMPISDPESWILGFPSPGGSSSSASSSASHDPVQALVSQPSFAATSPQMLMARFDRQTCGILSLKDGPNENPWRTLIWPMAQDSPALFHALASMTAFHTARERQSLRIEGMDHMRQSVQALAGSLSTMATDTALATTLALAFAESWDIHISTGIEHLRGARILVNRALTSRDPATISPMEFSRLKFLINTWVYMDVISRLTSLDDDVSNDFDHVIATSGTFGQMGEIDPLMGCATSLFPLIGRVANLGRRVRKSEANSPFVISQATELKSQIENWQIGSLFEPPEDPESEIKHSLQTAEAYRWATLLYLHQAVPEVPSFSSAFLAKTTLRYLATVPLKSRTVIVQIFPLLAAGCEVAGDEDRCWVRDRWAAMGARMWIGNIDRCVEVTKEVWNRRDEQMRQLASAGSILGLGIGVGPLVLVNGSIKRQIGCGFEDVHEDPFARPEVDDIQDFSKEKQRSSDRRSSSVSKDFKAREQLLNESAENYTEDLDNDMTARGRLHWVGVMRDWNWEVLLG